MKYFLLVGGFCGFLIAFASGITAGNDLSYVLRNATIGCLCGALLMRGFRLLLSHQLRQAAGTNTDAEMTPEAPAAPRG